MILEANDSAPFLTDIQHGNPSDDSLRSDIPTSTYFQPSTSRARRRQNPSRPPTLGWSRSLRVDALATRWRVLAACLDDGVCGY